MALEVSTEPVLVRAAAEALRVWEASAADVVVAVVAVEVLEVAAGAVEVAVVVVAVVAEGGSES